MFESAVKEESDMGIGLEGRQMNGPILSLSGALFLAKFLSTL